MSEHLFVTPSGQQVRLQPVALRAIRDIEISARRQALAAGEPIDPPTYTVETATGEHETYPHDETTLESDEDRARWEAHVAARQALMEKTNVRIGRYLLFNGLVDSQPPEQWVAEQALWGIEISADPMERRSQYIELELLRTTEDLLAVTREIMLISSRGQSAEVIDRLKAIFRDSLEGDAASGVGEAEGRVEL